MVEYALERAVVGGREPDRSGKVRDLFDLGDSLLLVTSDRISAFDRVLPTLIPGKGKVLNSLSSFWFDRLSGTAPNHMISTDPERYPEPFRSAAVMLEGRSMLVRKADVIPFECVVRGYLAGSGWKDYSAHGSVSGVTLPGGLSLSEKLSEPIFTPSTKAEDGHDEPVSFDRMADEIGAKKASQLRSLSIEIFLQASAHAEERGILLADTKFEFGRIDGVICLVDEVLSPDSSRFWKADRYRAGEIQESYDKQFVREYLLGLSWSGEEPAPELPEETVRATIERYREIFTILTG